MNLSVIDALDGARYVEFDTNASEVYVWDGNMSLRVFSVPPEAYEGWSQKEEIVVNIDDEVPYEVAEAIKMHQARSSLRNVSFMRMLNDARYIRVSDESDRAFVWYGKEIIKVFRPDNNGIWSHVRSIALSRSDYDVDAVAEMIEDRLIDVDEIARAIADTTDVGSEGDSNSAQPKVRKYKFRKLHNDA